MLYLSVRYRAGMSSSFSNESTGTNEQQSHPGSTTSTMYLLIVFPHVAFVRGTQQIVAFTVAVLNGEVVKDLLVSLH